MREIGVYRTKDSLSKGVTISYERKPAVQNKGLARLLTLKKPIPMFDPQLPMIEEETKRDLSSNKKD